jgi:hypothetical protein
MCFKHSFVKIYNQFNKFIKALHSNKGDEIYSVQHLSHTLKRSWCYSIVHTKQCSSSKIVVEKKNMIILKKAFHLAFGAHIPTQIWAILGTFSPPK